MPKYPVEQTLVLIKPDALKLSLTGYILSTLAEPHTGLRIAGAKIVNVSDTMAREHYAEHRGKPFYDSLIEYLTGRIHYSDEMMHKRRVVALVYVGEGAVARIRQVAGPTNPHVARESAPGTIRSLGTLVPDAPQAPNLPNKENVDRIDNLIHASANLEDAEREAKLWFKPRDICPQVRAWETDICEDHFYCNSDGALTTVHQKGDTCLLAPGKLAWKTDLELLYEILEKGGTDPRIWSVAAKYLVNGPEDFV